MIIKTFLTTAESIQSKLCFLEGGGRWGWGVGWGFFMENAILLSVVVNRDVLVTDCT